MATPRDRETDVAGMARSITHGASRCNGGVTPEWQFFAPAAGRGDRESTGTSVHLASGKGNYEIESLAPVKVFAGGWFDIEFKIDA